MPYKDLQRKREWEQLHRPSRLARRRELRMEAARKAAEPAAARVENSETNLLWLPLVVGGALAFYNPKLAIGTGSLTLFAAAVYKKGSSWWLIGIGILMVGLFSQWYDQKA